MLRKVAPLDTTSLTKTDDSSYDTITEFINEQCKSYGDELASKSDFEYSLIIDINLFERA